MSHSKIRFYQEKYNCLLNVTSLISGSEHVLMLQNIFSNEEVMSLALKYKKDLQQSDFLTLACEDDVIWTPRKIKILALYNMALAQSKGQNVRAKAIKEMNELNVGLSASLDKQH